MDTLRNLTRSFACAFAAIVLSCFQMSGQVYDVLEQVASSRDKLSGVEGPYRFDARPLTPAPKGYAPFYISHYGRHGSRYAWSSNTYTWIKEVLETAREADALTPRGKKFYDDYMAFYQVPLMNTGDLSDLGGWQHGEIARIMCEEFPEVFKDGGKVLAKASTSPRAIVSMSAFTVSLQKHAPKVDIEVNSLHTNLPATIPWNAPKEMVKVYRGDVAIPESTDDFRDRMTDYDGILDNLFSDRGFLEQLGGRREFVYELFNLWAGCRNYDEGSFLDGIFTDEQLVREWECENYSHWAGHSRNRYLTITLLDDIIDSADESIATGAYKGHFRFGHDTVLNAFVTLLNINGCAHLPEKAEDVKYWFQNYNTPMGANLQFVFYRSRKSPSILFKLLRNGEEVSLPQLTAVDGPYYSWDDFKAWAVSVKNAHPLVKE